MAEYTQEQREQAARIMSQLKEGMPYKDSGEFETTIIMEAYDLAIAALRGEHDTTATSWYSKKLYCDTCGERIIGKKHSYCPMCGRKLEVEK